MKFPRYFMLAHGIAHNLVYPHNLEHEFYVSAICEAYLEPLFGLLSDRPQLFTHFARYNEATDESMARHPPSLFANDD